MLLARMDEYGKAAWLGLAVLAFLATWLLGLALLTFLVVSERTRAWRAGARHLLGHWSNLRSRAIGMTNWTSPATLQASVNMACSSYETVELSGFVVQEHGFRSFLNRLCLVRNKEEFDRFVAEQRRVMAGQSPSGRHGS